MNGRHLSSDSLFIEKRRRGLVRFLNALVQHPVLSQEQLVVMFLTVPTVSLSNAPFFLPKVTYKQYQELSVWRKQATISVQEEFTGKALPPDLEDSLPQNLSETFDTVRSGVRQAAENYIGLCNLLERLTKRTQGIAADHLRFSQALTALAESSQNTYAVDTNDVPLLNEGINSTAKHMNTAQALLEDEARAWDEGALEDFKKQRDALVSLRELFDRRDRLAKDNIPQLERRIEVNEGKLRALINSPGGKPGEMEKLETAVRNVSDQYLSSSFILSLSLLPLGPPSPLPISDHSIDGYRPSRRTNNPSQTSTPAASSSRSASATSSTISRAASTTSAACIRIGARSVSSTRSCRPIIGGGWATRSSTCLRGSE